jgi:hypothetical protein
MSRRITFGIAIVAVLMLVFAGLAWAQTPEVTETPTPTVTDTVTAPVGCPYGSFVDNDGDGLCDYREDAATGQQWGPVGMMGHMMNSMMQRGHNFVDTDGDGVCDHREDGIGMQRNNATRHGMGMSRMGGNGMNNGMGQGWSR